MTSWGRNENCIISIPQFGTVRIKVDRIVYGVNLFSLTAGEEESRHGKQFFTTHMTSGGFELSVVFTSYKSYETFMKWLERYTRWMSDPRSPGAPARVIVAARKFDKTGVLESGITYGEQVGQFVWRTTLSFMGSRDPLDLNDAEVYLNNVAQFTPGKRDKEVARYYPAGGAGASGRHSWNALGTIDDPDRTHRGGQ